MQVPSISPWTLTRAATTPVFCFTSDIDWAPEWAIADTLALFDRFDVPLTPFVTHDSPLLRARYGKPGMRRRVGLHPNFLPGSSHGSDPETVIDHVCRLWPEAVAFRAHAFFEYAAIPVRFAERGFLYDSNLCLFLQPHCVPLAHASGLTRFPVIWTDYAHLLKGLDCEIGTIKATLATPGLKVIDVHPMLIALNAPEPAYYQTRKALYRVDDAATGRAERHEGPGIADLLGEMLSFVRNSGYATVYLDDLYRDLAESGGAAA